MFTPEFDVGSVLICETSTCKERSVWRKWGMPMKLEESSVFYLDKIERLQRARLEPGTPNETKTDESRER